MARPLYDLSEVSVLEGASAQSCVAGAQEGGSPSLIS